MAGGPASEPERIATHTVLWAAGVAASPLARTLGAPLDRAGRVLVNKDLTLPGRDDVYVIGDMAALTDAAGRPVPGLAPAAMQEGQLAARNILHRIRREPREDFHYIDRGSLATIGRNRAVGEIKGVRLSGYVAWLAWALIHLMLLIGFRSRVLVFLQWTWSYLTFGRGARLITGSVAPKPLPPASERSNAPPNP
jgi:NADH dehydrogenase